jgi:hypothetical protein
VTLILSCLTPEYVLQVSDRRLTMLDGSVRDDDATKAVVFELQVAFGYTGLAELPRSQAARQRWPRQGANWVPTNEWLAEVLAIAGQEGDPITRLAQETVASLRRATYRVRDPMVRRIAFIAVGWTQVPPDGDDQPVLFTLSNLDDPSQLTSRLETLGRRVSAVHSSLAHESTLRDSLERGIAKCVRHRTGPAAAGRLLVEAIRDVAARDKTVGRGLLVNCVPLNAIKAARAGGSFGLAASEPSLDGATFYYMPATGDFVQHAPELVGPMGNVFINTTVSGHGGDVVRIVPPPATRQEPS